jgi:hypothetical protein
MHHFATMYSYFTFHTLRYEGDKVYEINSFSPARSEGRRKHTREINEENLFTTKLNTYKMFRQMFTVAFIRSDRRFQHKSGR